MTDRYEFNNPYEGDWNECELSVKQNPDTAVFTFNAGMWDIKHTIVVTRKPEPIKAGQVWVSSHESKKTVRHVYFDETLKENVIVFQHGDNTLGAFPENKFRLCYRKGSAS